ncbi:LysR family transcriptional regulator [Noviherbaspirillum suwonense]|uniref:Transcriptional regulator, LysR family n=1 Tax=Noviherbaspirillum suwonense TaxID=1224511 RepID=A0ABY1QTV6_9BURK|nr:LysR family transcriptional regulator [Noviherbaspirillum suwonense]SMP78981.1 transcriptional regulator, LysR family [Noviherbaspirillum suwonense]
MDLRRIRHFVVLAETLNFRRAAERLHMAQPPLSVSIQKLEAEVGTKLFIRSPSGVSLTPSGKSALAEARRLLFHGSQFAQVAKSASDGTGGTLHVGFVGSTTFGMLQKLVPQFRAEYPGVELVLREATSARIVQMVEDDGLDVGLVRTPLLHGSTVTLVPLEQDRFIAALPRNSRLVNVGQLTLSDLATEPFIMYNRTEAAGLHTAAILACQQAGFLPRIAQEAVQVQTVLSLVESCLGVALVPSVMQRSVNDMIVYRAFTDFAPPADIGLALIYQPEMESPAAKRFRALACREYPLPR